MGHNALAFIPLENKVAEEGRPPQKIFQTKNFNLGAISSCHNVFQNLGEGSEEDEAKPLVSSPRFSIKAL